VTANLRGLLAKGGETLVAPGASDALSARLIEAHGYKCVYIGSYATAASRFAIPDTGLLSLEQLAAHAKTIADAVRVPVIADAEGFDNAVPAFEAAGVAAIHIEDHTGAGKHTNKEQTLRAAEDVAERIRAAVAARRNPDFLIVARSDAFWVHRDLEDCIARLVDMPGRTLAEHAGAAIVLYYAFSITRHFEALQRALSDGNLASDTRPLEDFLGYKDAHGRSRR
jgi:2-methylisocitrate lyase-like PEP mutase family enzyme